MNIRKLMGPQKSVSYIRGSECDIRIKSSRESVHYIHSPNVSNCINSVYNRINLSFLSSQSFTQRTQLALIFWMVFRYFIYQVILFLSVVQQATYILNLSIIDRANLIGNYKIRSEKNPIVANSDALLQTNFT